MFTIVGLSGRPDTSGKGRGGDEARLPSGLGWYPPLLKRCMLTATLLEMGDAEWPLPLWVHRWKGDSVPCTQKRRGREQGEKLAKMT